MNNKEIEEFYREECRIADQRKVQNKAEIIKLKSDYEKVFSTPEGERVFEDLLSRCHVFASIFVKSAEIYKLEGERNIGLFLLKRRGLMAFSQFNKWYSNQLINKRKEG